MIDKDLKKRTRDEMFAKSLGAIDFVRKKFTTPTKDEKDESRQTRN